MTPTHQAMKRYIFYFLAAFAGSFIPLQSESQALLHSDTLMSPGHMIIMHDSTSTDIPFYIDSRELIMFFERTFGSIITTVAMYFLHSKYPKIFPTRKKADYYSRPRISPRDKI
jgi:hypothetical protein